MSAPLGRLRLPWVDLPLFGLLLACAPVCALPDLPEQVGLGPGGASLLERAALPQVLGLAQVQRLVTRALEHCVKTSDGMNENLHDLVYDALSEEWGIRDGEIEDPWESGPSDGYQPSPYGI